MNLGLVRKVSLNDVLDIVSLLPLAEKAVELEEFLSTEYAYVEEGVILEVYRHKMEAGNYGYYELEFVTRKDGKLHWMVQRYHLDYDLTIDRDEIFSLLKSSYLLEQGYPLYGKNGKDYSDVGAISIVNSHFKNFVERSTK